MRVTQSFRSLKALVVLSMTVAACAPSRRAPSVVERDAAEYTRSVVARGRHLDGGLSVLSSPEGDVLLVPNGGTIDELDGETGTLRGRLASPLSSVDNIVRDGRNLVLLSAASDRVVVWDPVGDVEVESHGGYAGAVNATRFSGQLLIVEVERGSISRQAADGGEADTFVAGMRAPAGLAGTNRDLWVADRASGTILQLVANGQRLAEPFEVASGLAQPEGLGVTAAGSLIVAETGAHRLSRIDPKTRSIGTIDDQVALDPAPGSGHNPIGTFASVAVGACGTIYVTADATGEIIRYVPVGSVVCHFGE
jgi:DNA-binding beta-propeller fold protein YncE